MSGDKKIGIFDSGTGGLVILKSIVQVLPQYSYIYYGDTLRAPYGNLSQREIRQFTLLGVEELFRQGCVLVILACNTASAEALRYLQLRVLPISFPHRNVLGVIVPTVEAALSLSSRQIGVLGTKSTVKSHAYSKEIKKRSPEARVIERALPELATLIDQNDLSAAESILKNEIHSLINENIETILLACTHYSIALTKDFVSDVDKQVTILSQDDIIPVRLDTYLKKHLEFLNQLDDQGTRDFFLTRDHKQTVSRIHEWFKTNPTIISSHTRVERATHH